MVEYRVRGLEHRLPHRGDVPEISDKMASARGGVHLLSAQCTAATWCGARRQVVELDMSVDEAMKMIITAVWWSPNSPCGRDPDPRRNPPPEALPP